MNKEEAKKEFAQWAINQEGRIDRAMVMNHVLWAIDNIELEHSKVVLPKIIGMWVSQCARVHMPERLINENNTPGDVDDWLMNNGNNYDEDRQKQLMLAYVNGWVPEPRYLVYVPQTGQGFVYTHGPWIDGKIHVEVHELDEQSDDPTELFTMEEIDELKLQDYEREEVQHD